MTVKLPTVAVHVRTGPNIDVAACGERGSQLRFSWALKGVTCTKCIEKRGKDMTLAGRTAFGKRISKITAAVRAANAENLLDRDARRTS